MRGAGHASPPYTPITPNPPHPGTSTVLVVAPSHISCKGVNIAIIMASVHAKMTMYSLFEPASGQNTRKIKIKKGPQNRRGATPYSPPGHNHSVPLWLGSTLALLVGMVNRHAVKVTVRPY